jgi:hypothetical protein
MAHIVRTVSLVLTLAAVGAGAGVATAEGQDPIRVGANTATPIAHVTPVDAPDVAAPPLTEYERGLVDWAKGRFAEARLELPELKVRFDPSGGLCGPNEGRYQQTPDGERIITICTRESDSFAADLHRRRTLLHEFGHAWDLANLSDDDHDELMHQLDVESWNDHDAAWADRGVERFAETFVYALLDQPRRQLKVDLACDDLIGAFQTATGSQPLGPGVPHCAS